MSNYRFEDYVKKARRTMNKDMSTKEQVINCQMGIVGETGELVDMYKKHFYQGHDLNKADIQEEIGDICWYLFNYVNLVISEKDKETLYDRLRAYTEVYGNTQFQDTKHHVRALARNMSPFIGYGTPDILDIMAIYETFVKLLAFEGFTIENTLDCNIAKLEKRYDNLKFEVEKSVNREE